MNRRALLLGLLAISQRAHAQMMPVPCGTPSPNCIIGGPSLVTRRVYGVAVNGALIGLKTGEKINAISLLNTTANAVTGGINIGTTPGGSDVVSAFAVGANVTTGIIGTTLLKTYFSATLPVTLYVSAVSGWNSAVLDFAISIQLADPTNGV
jgi:hypothetical protein